MLRIETHGRVRLITLDRPAARNAVDPALARWLYEALLEFDANPDVDAAVLTGAGGVFCAGFDLKAAATGAAEDWIAGLQIPETWRDPIGQPLASPMGPARLMLSKPVIAAINGAAAGVGLCLALYCDLRFIAENARITTAFSRRGLPAEHGSAWMLPRLIGWMNAADLLLSGRVVTGREAADLGLARCLPDDEFLDAVQSYARDLAQHCSPRSMMVMKRQLRAAWTQSLAQATAQSNRETELSLEADDVAEGIAHFLEKRPPRFPPLS